MKLYCTILFTLLLASANAQLTLNGQVETARRNRVAYADTVWTITGKKALDHRYRRWKLDFVLDARQTLVSNTRVRIGGLRVGAEYRRVHRFGFGIYFVGDSLTVNTLMEVDPRIDSARVGINYQSIYYERVLLFSKKWEVSATVHLGSGILSSGYIDPDTGKHLTFYNHIQLAEFSTTTYFNLTYFISVGAGVGYRFINNAPSELEPVYTAPVGIFRVRFKLLKMARGIWNKDVRTAY